MSKKNGPTPFLTNLVGHVQKKVENPWFRLCPVFPLLRFVDQSLFLYYTISLLFEHHMHTCLVSHRRNYDEQKAVILSGVA